LGRAGPRTLTLTSVSDTEVFFCGWSSDSISTTNSLAAVPPGEAGGAGGESETLRPGDRVDLRTGDRVLDLLTDDFDFRPPECDRDFRATERDRDFRTTERDRDFIRARCAGLEGDRVLERRGDRRVDRDLLLVRLRLNGLLDLRRNRRGLLRRYRP